MAQCIATEAYIQAFDAMHWAINTLKYYCEKLVIVYIPGNHDRLSSFHLVHALSKSIECEDIEWDIKYEERKVHKLLQFSNICIKQPIDSLFPCFGNNSCSCSMLFHNINQVQNQSNRES